MESISNQIQTLTQKTPPRFALITAKVRFYRNVAQGNDPNTNTRPCRAHFITNAKEGNDAM